MTKKKMEGNARLQGTDSSTSFFQTDLSHVFEEYSFLLLSHPAGVLNQSTKRRMVVSCLVRPSNQTHCHMCTPSGLSILVVLLV